MEEQEREAPVVTAFVSKKIDTRTQIERGGSISSRRSAGNRFGAGFLIVRLAICAVCFGAVIALKLRGGGEALEAVSAAVNSTPSTETEEKLGRLKFIDLPSIIEVFAPSSDPISPVEFTSAKLEDDGLTLVLEAAPRSPVVCPAAGKVTNIGVEDGVRFVTVLAANDIEFTLSGLAEVCVDKGQPVAQRQQIGPLADGGLSVRVYRSGRPILPGDYFTGLDLI